MGGQIPRTDARMLGDNMAEAAVNCDLTSGALDALPIPELLQDFSANPNPVDRAYRYPDPTGGTNDAWIPLPSPYSSAVRSPLTNDTNNRVYWTNPGDPIPWWNTYARIIAGSPAYNLGTIQPVNAPSVTAQGGTTDGSVTNVDRSYVYTYVNQYGEESAPSPPSADTAGPSDATWFISGLPPLPANPAGVNYPPLVSINIYRTITSASQGAQFYLVANVPFGPSDYNDVIPDTTVVNNLTLPSANWGNPPANLDGLVAMTGGMLIGFTGNTVHFCEPDHPHTWPAMYDESVSYPVVTMVVWMSYLMVLTTGFPSIGSGNVPSSFTFTTSRVPEPCISRGSVITDLMAVYYASQNGLVMLNYFGMQNQVLTMVEKNDWLNRWKAGSPNFIACRHRAQYLAINGSGTGFIIDYSEPRLGFVNLSTVQGASCVWNDEYNGDTYICAGKKVYRWDSQNTGPLTFRWRSKRFFTPASTSVGAMQVSVDPAVLTPPPDPLPAPPLSNGDSTLTLPAGANVVFNLYAGPSQTLVFSRTLTKPESIFRIPGGFKSNEWQMEIVSRVRVRQLQIASTMHELKNV